MTRNVGVLVLATVLAGLPAVPAARACSCGGGGEGLSAADVASYDAVFEGRPITISRDDEVTPSGGIVHRGYRVLFRVHRQWRGPARNTAWVHTGPLPVGCGVEFSLEENYVVFARAVSGRLETGICDPTGRVGERRTLIEELGQANAPEASEVSAGWPPVQAASHMGLPASVEAGTEIRVWLGGGIVRPFHLYRLVRNAESVRAQHLVWTREYADDGAGRSEREVRKETRRARRFLAKYYCDGEVSKDGEYFWCEIPVRDTDTWGMVFADLLPAELRVLPEQPDRECGWDMMDGETVAIEILDSGRRHFVSYANPDFCCAEVACAIANHVRRVVQQQVR